MCCESCDVALCFPMPPLGGGLLLQVTGCPLCYNKHASKLKSLTSRSDNPLYIIEVINVPSTALTWCQKLYHTCKQLDM